MPFRQPKAHLSGDGHDFELDDVRRLQEISSLLIAESNIEALYDGILEAAIGLMRSDMGTMQIFEPDTGELRLLGARGFDPAAVKVFERVNQTTGSTCAAAMSARRRIVVPDVEICDFIVGNPVHRHLRSCNIRAAQSTPLIARDGSLIGMITTHWRNPHQPPESRLRLVDLIARQAADLIERTRNEGKLRLLAAIVESTDDAVVTKNLDGIITSWNRGAERIFGYLAEEIIGKSITVLIPSERQDEEPAIIERIRRGERVEHYQTVRQRKDGSKLDISLTVSPLKDAAGKIVGASKIARDITDGKRAEAQIAMLAREAEHRAKNMLATVQATVHLSQCDTADGLKRAIMGRIRALANVHRLFVDTRWSGANLRTLAVDELSPYCQDSDARAQVDGTDITVKPDAAQALAVILHELATNAAKYGALSVPGGRVHVGWSDATDGRLTLRWTETGGPPATPPTREGFGTRVMKNMICSSLKGDMRLDWREGGLVCEIALPI
jgi:PAS domain S-box-containing protein